jgi:hypothetical protein
MYMIVKYYLTAYPAVYGQFSQAIPQPIAAIPSVQREGKTQHHKIKIDHK